MVRSTWDYTDQVGSFLSWCRRVGDDRLRNRPALVAFNADKRYLAELAAPTVPSTFVGPGDPVPALTGEVVVKPNVSAGRTRHRAVHAVHARGGALTEAGVDHTLVTYSAAHGFAVPDNPTYDEAAAARHWEALAELYSSVLATP